MGIHEQARNETKEHFDVQISERKVWAEVLLQALEDWHSGNVRRRIEAEKFFFDCEKDFASVCRGAGLEPSSVLVKLQRMKHVTQPLLSAAALSRGLTQQATSAA